MSKAQAQQLVGQTLGGKYRLQKYIGAGATAWVYMARDQRNTNAALKILTTDNPDAVRLFTREIKVLKALPKSPYCVQYIDDGVTDDGKPYLVMEYIDGCTLKDAFKFQPSWEVNEACQLMLQLCEALAGLHRLGVAHRDLKPENIMLTRTWKVKLMDFGLVKDAQGLLKLFETEDILAGRDFMDNFDRQLLAGTPEYMAPEQFSDPMLAEDEQQRTDTWSDVYSLGVIFFEVLTGKKLFPLITGAKDQTQYSKDLFAYIKKRQAFQDASLQRPEEIPQALFATIACAVRQNPKQRQPTAQDLARDIQRFVDTGEGGSFDEYDQLTSMADISQLSALLDAQQGGAPADPRGAATVPPPGKKKPSMRPPGPDSGPVDVGAVQAMREEQLATAPPKGASGLPSFGLDADDLFDNVEVTMVRVAAPLELAGAGLPPLAGGGGPTPLAGGSAAEAPRKPAGPSVPSMAPAAAAPAPPAPNDPFAPAPPRATTGNFPTVNPYAPPDAMGTPPANPPATASGGFDAVPPSATTSQFNAPPPDTTKKTSPVVYVLFFLLLAGIGAAAVVFLKK